ncbi:MAG: selenocysteine-specific translation elongation factor [Planctomycetes bacterium]|nr:selenocysteine-specific translation elongation factor [Planctomycetota bacterium]
MARELILGTAGHIDHGKTALVRALTGVDTDRLPQEKQRGITIDIGFADLTIGDVHFGIVDVPGHERFVKNMLAGAVGIDMALLVVAADDSVMPQTREHLAIMRLLGIGRGVIALTKSDLVEASWLDLVRDDIRTLTAGTFLEGAAIVATSTKAGVGLDKLREALSEAATATPQRTSDGPFRLVIDRSFVLEGRGTVVTGTAWSGRVGVGDELEWLPVRRRVRVRAIQTHGRSVDAAVAGQRVALNLSGAHHSEIARGHELAAPGSLEPSRRITVRLGTLADGARPIRHRSRVRLHIGSSELMASVRLLDGPEVRPGEYGIAQLVCAQPVVARCRQPFVVRGESPVTTLGGGIVLQPTPGPISRRDPASCARLADLGSDDPSVRAETAVFFRDTRRWDFADLEREADLAPGSVKDVIEGLTSDGRLVAVPASTDAGALLHRDRFEQLTARVMASMRALHAAAPLESAIPRSRLASELAYVEERLLDGVLDLLARRGDIRMKGDGIALSSFEPALSERQLSLCEHVDRVYRDAAFRPPLQKDLAVQLDASESELAPVIELCVSRGRLVRIGSGFVLHARREEELRQRIAGRLREIGEMTVSQIKDELDSSRKYAVPICEYLDRIGVTRRVGNVRVIGSRAETSTDTCHS